MQALLPEDVATPLLRERIRALFGRLPKAVAGNEEAIHQMRVMGRRLRVALPLLARKPTGRRVRRSLRQLRLLTRTAGHSRDFDVIQDRLHELVQSQAEPSGEMKVLLARLAAARRRSRARMGEALLDLEIAGLRRDLRAIVRRQGETRFGVLLRLREARERESRRAFDVIEAMDQGFEPDLLHKLRRICRRLRYTSEVADVVRGQESPAAAQFKALQDELGTIHDDWVLCRWLELRAEGAHRSGQSSLAEAARRLGDQLRDRSSHGHRELLEGGLRERVGRAAAEMGGARSAA